jgi:hypothetical protein
MVSVYYLVLTAIFALLGQFLTLFNDFKLSILGVFVYNLGFFFFYLHYDALSSLTPTYRVFATLLILNSTSLGIVVCSALGIIIDLVLAFLMTRLITTISSLIALTLVTIIIYRIHRVANEKTTLWQLIGTSLLFVCRIIFLARDVTDAFLNLLANQTQAYNILTIIALVFAVSGLSIILLNHIISPDFLYKLPSPIRAIMIYNSKGLIVYSKQTITDSFPYPFEELLVSGAFKAISNLISETLGTGADIQHIKAKKYHIFFVDLPENQGTLVVIALGATYFFKQSLERFSQLIPDSLLTQINEPNLNIRSLKDNLNTLLKKTFPYLKL